MNTATPVHAAAEPTPRRLAWAASVVALVLLALMAYWLWVLRDHRLQFTARQLVLQTAALSEHVRVVFDTVDASLRGTRADLDAGRILPDSTAQPRLRLRAGDDLYVRELALATGDGHIVATSSAASSAARALPAGDPAAALRIGTARAGDAESIELARSVSAAPDALQIVAVADARFIERFFTRVAIASDARFGVYTLDGQRLAGNLDLAELEGADGDSNAAALLQYLLEPNAPVAHARIFATAQRLRGLPLVAISSRDRRAVLAPWYEYLASATVITAIALGLLIFVVRRLQHETLARVQAQAALARRAEQTRRLEALGRLSGGIAHDFNNVLAAILGYADLLGQQVPAGTPAARSAEQVLRAGERGRRLVARILGFSRGGPKPQTAVAVLPIVREVLDLLAATLPPTVRLERAFDAVDSAAVRGDATQLFEAVHNLCTNALQAMPNGGVLRVGLGTSAAGHASAAERVVLRIADTGHGLSAEAAEHLFEPFFTTRAGAGGSGLGLAIVHAAVQDMGGTIDVQSTPGRGTSFTLSFPRVEAPPPRDAEAPADAPRGSGQVVMVVDDEPALVALTEEVLAGMGYEPAGFADPQVALAALRETPERYEALLVDQVMPSMNGTELARQFRALRPDAPILLVSGYGGANLDERARAAGVSIVLQKPLHRAELGTHLAQAFAD